MFISSCFTWYCFRTSHPVNTQAMPRHRQPKHFHLNEHFHLNKHCFPLYKGEIVSLCPNIYQIWAILSSFTKFHFLTTLVKGNKDLCQRKESISL